MVFSLFWWFLLPLYPLSSVFLIMCLFCLYVFCGAVTRQDHANDLFNWFLIPSILFLVHSNFILQKEWQTEIHINGKNPCAKSMQMNLNLVSLMISTDSQIQVLLCIYKKKKTNTKKPLVVQPHSPIDSLQIQHNLLCTWFHFCCHCVIDKFCNSNSFLFQIFLEHIKQKGIHCRNLGHLPC